MITTVQDWETAVITLVKSAPMRLQLSKSKWQLDSRANVMASVMVILERTAGVMTCANNSMIAAQTTPALSNVGQHREAAHYE